MTSKKKHPSHPSEHDIAAAIPRWQPMLRALIRRTVLDSHAAEDILQTVMLQALRAANQLRDPRKLPGWLRVIARNAVRDWLRQKHGHRWSELADSMESATPERQDEIFGAIDEIARHISGLRLPEQHDRVLVLRHVMNWSPAEIGATLGMPARRISQILQHAKHAGPAAESAAERESREVLCKVRIATVMFQASLIFPAGARSLLQEALAWIRLAAMRHPNHPAVLGSASWICFRMGMRTRRSETPERRRAVAIAGFRSWNRESWDWKLMDEGAAYYRRMLENHPDDFSRLYMERYFLIWYARRHEDVPFERALAASSKLLELRPRKDHYIDHVMILREVHGASAAARFLQARRRIPGLRDNPIFYLTLGSLYYDCRQWKLARAALSRFLRYPFNDVIRRDVRDWVARCNQALTSSAGTSRHKMPPRKRPHKPAL